MPRWAWIALFSGAVMVGLYLRTRSDEEEFGPEEEGIEEPVEGELPFYDGTEQAGGLAAAGLVGPAQGQVLPVEAPYIPQGFVDIFGSQSETLGSAIGALAEREPGERVETIREVEPIGEGSGQGLPTGGGPPKKKPHHKPPKKPKQHKPARPRPQGKPKKGKPHKRKPRRRIGVGKGQKAK